jgi:hypothetical protein
MDRQQEEHVRAADTLIWIKFPERAAKRASGEAGPPVPDGAGN